MSMESVIFLPETVVTDLLGRDLPASVGQEFDYNGKRYKVRQRDPARSEGGVPCELVEPVVQHEKRRRRAKGSPILIELHGFANACFQKQVRNQMFNRMELTCKVLR